MPPPPRVHFVDIPPPDVIWLMAGAHATPQAREGARVPAGAIVAGVEHTSTLAVTPLAGEVGQVRPVRDTRGRELEAVALLVGDDAEQQEPAAPPAPARLSAAGREDLPAWIDRLERAGVRADRHHSPDLTRQLIGAMRRPIDAVVCHALDADPTLPLQAQWALRHAEELRDGLRLLARLTGARRTVVGVSVSDHRRLYRRLRRSLGPAPAAGVAGLESERPEVAEPQEVLVPFSIAPGAGAATATAGAEAREPAPVDQAPPDARARARAEALGMRLVPLLNTYPQADPTLLVWSLLGRRLRPGALPTESAGVIVLDAAAAVAVGTVARGAGAVRRQPVAVRDHRSEVSILADVWRGSRLIDVLRALGLAPPASADAGGEAAGEGIEVRAGDYLRDAVVDADCVLDGGELVFHVTSARPLPAPPEPCIRCGWCLDICPTHVHPAGVLEAAQRQSEDLAEQFGLRACIECGLCSYICPSRLPLLEAARGMKGK